MATIKETGKIIALGEIKSGALRDGGTWSRQDCIIEIPISENSHKDVSVSLNTEQIELVKRLSLGTIVDVEYYVTAREWQGKWYNNVNVRSIAPVALASTPQTPQYAPVAQPAPVAKAAPAAWEKEEEPDLPF
mgnify:CR=1 FL=1